MWAIRSVRLGVLLSLAAACNGPGDEGQVDGSPPGAPDANPGGSTLVTGQLGTISFQLTHADVAFDTLMPDVHTLCVADRPMTAPDCGYSDGVDQTVLLGTFYFDTAGMPRWSLIFTELRRIGPDERLEIPTAGQLSVASYDKATGTIAATFTLTFSSGVTSGTVVVP